MNAVNLKFECTSITTHKEGHKQVNFQAKLDAPEDRSNADYAAGTPSAAMTVVISPEAPAADYFKPGQTYFVLVTDIAPVRPPEQKN